MRCILYIDTVQLLLRDHLLLRYNSVTLLLRTTSPCHEQFFSVMVMKSSSLKQHRLKTSLFFRQYSVSFWQDGQEIQESIHSLYIDLSALFIFWTSATKVMYFSNYKEGEILHLKPYCIVSKRTETHSCTCTIHTLDLDVFTDHLMYRKCPLNDLDQCSYSVLYHCMYIKHHVFEIYTILSCTRASHSPIRHGRKGSSSGEQIYIVSSPVGEDSISARGRKWFTEHWIETICILFCVISQPYVKLYRAEFYPKLMAFRVK